MSYRREIDLLHLTVDLCLLALSKHFVVLHYYQYLLLPLDLGSGKVKDF